MQIMRAFRAETLSSPDVKGRTARAPDLGFLIVAMMLFAIVIWLVVILLPQDLSWAAISTVIVLFYVPVSAAGVRRLHDLGKRGTLMLDPVKPLAAFGLCLLLMGAALAAVARSLMFFSNTMGLLLLPSQPGPNSYGPNPYEVQT